MDLFPEGAWPLRGCPICRLLERDEFDLMCHLQYQTIHDEEIKDQIVAHQGYCRFHFYEMARLTTPRAMAILIKELIDQKIKEIKENHYLSLENGNCLICEELRKREDAYLVHFFNLLAEDSFPRKYSQSDGLGHFHLKKILALAKESVISQFLLVREEEQLKNFQKNLENFLRKEKSKDKMSEQEKKAWWWGMQKLVGKRGL